MKEKKELKNKLETVEVERDKLKKSCEQDVVKIKARFQKERQDIETQIEELEVIEEVILYNRGILEVQNRLF